ncbi:P-loop containing nucleoside triphosphate hydrolase protein [Decorospora gaudefroyi]|uniref:P-loop containing nucleoside triphosphate hydrolase protein n=1 Tax=Decorospora gaudefroyi TaxID=184978 RepID=A0A6A5K0R1_9PLEO|nr:P-loop containing nucleoside triphosphate hydrolase protein [Decorospora gaudefroyi]
MEFSRLQDVVSEFTTSNDSNPNPTSFPSTVLELLVPGYGTIAQLTSRYLGFDIGILVSSWLLVFGLYHGSRYVYEQAYHYLTTYYTSSIEIDQYEAFYVQAMDWISYQYLTKTTRHVTVATNPDPSDPQNTPDGAVFSTSKLNVLPPSEINALVDDNNNNNNKNEDIFSYSKWASTIPPIYNPQYGDYDFRHQGRWFRFQRKRTDTKTQKGFEESIQIRCWGRSTEPLKDLLTLIKTSYLRNRSSTTTIFHATGGSSHGGGGEPRHWRRQATRASRPLSTVSLDRQQKTKIVADINEYLSPATAQWYSARGIPHRRGYLFHGGPGTGKTSLSFALAGLFGLDVYCLSLNKGVVTESELTGLFAELPARCFVLLEDVDSAGVAVGRREGVCSSSSSSSSGTGTMASIGNGMYTESTTANPLSAPAPTQPQTSISLSALLNTIDGAASHEGHVLIMTTNTRPDLLDEALLRPGRIDLSIEFTRATRSQIYDIFLSMFQTQTQDPASKPGAGGGGGRDSGGGSGGGGDKVGGEKDNIAQLAQHFSSLLPNGTFSPAQIQGFLLRFKGRPEEALEGVVAWRDGVRK